MKNLIEKIKKALGLNKKSPESSNGFTLIELLVVIAIIGILGAAVLAAINPIQRFNQARDAGAKNGMGQVITAFQAYYTETAQTSSTQYYPNAVSVVAGSGKDLKQEPKTPDNSSFTVTGPSGCSTTISSCTDVVVYFTLKNPVKTGNDVHSSATSCNTTTGCDRWCWKSSTGVVGASTSTGCTP